MSGSSEATRDYVGPIVSLAFQVATPLLLAIAYYVIAETAMKSWLGIDRTSMPPVFVLLAIQSGTAGFWTVDRLRSACGVSRGDQHIEIRRGATRPGSIQPDEVIELFRAREHLEQRKVLAVAIPSMMGLLAYLGEVTGWPWILLIAASAGATLWTFASFGANLPALRVDEGGISARCSRIGIRNVHVPWSQVETCRFVFQDVPSRMMEVAQLDFCDLNGQRLLSFGPITRSKFDQDGIERIVEHLRKRFAERDDTPWDG